MYVRIWAAKGDGVLAGVFRLSFRIAFLQFNVVQAGAQNAHGRILVVVLRFFVLALGGNTRGDVGHAHGRTCGVDALPAGPLERKISTRMSDSLMSSSISLPTSGITSTDAKEVWRRPMNRKAKCG